MWPYYNRKDEYTQAEGRVEFWVERLVQNPYTLLLTNGLRDPSDTRVNGGEYCAT